MLLIAAVAFWLVGLNAWSTIYPSLTLEESGKIEIVIYRHDVYGSVAGALAWYDEGSLYFLGIVLLTGFYLCARFRAPRLPWRRVIVQPGILICLMIPCAYLIAGCIGPPGDVTTIADPASVYAIRSYLLSAAVGFAWISTYLALRSSTERGWIEWGGRVVGIGWIGIGLVNFVMLSLFGSVDLEIIDVVFPVAVAPDGSGSPSRSAKMDQSGNLSRNERREAINF
jgi:hypothetical protein